MSRSIFKKLSVASFAQFLIPLSYSDNGVHVHDMQQVGEAYQVTGRDPYMVFPSSHPNILSNQSDGRLAINLQIQNISELKKAPKGELFSKLQDGSDTRTFDPNYKLRFHFPNKDFSRILFPSSKIGNHTSNAQPSFFRIDFDDCQRCIITLKNNSENSVSEASVYRSYAGLNDVSIDGLKISPEKWSLNDLERQGSMISTTGGDPYLVSPLLDVNTSTLAGVYFELEPNQASAEPYDFQLFYATESHRFVEKATIFFRVAASTDNFVRFFIPLDFLIQEHPKQLRLEQLRLDLASHGTRSRHDTEFKFINAQLIHKNQVKEYRSLIPSGLVNLGWQKQSKRQVISGIFSKVFSDLAFVIFYLALLIGFGLYLLRSWRNAK